MKIKECKKNKIKRDYMKMFFQFFSLVKKSQSIKNVEMDMQTCNLREYASNG